MNKIIKLLSGFTALVLFCVSSTMAVLIFSPNNDGIKDTTVFKLQVSTPREDISKWTFKIIDTNKKLINEFKGDGPPPEKLQWDGRDANKLLVLDGVYKYIFIAITKAGNEEKLTPQDIIIDHTKPTATVSVDLDIFSPNADGIKDEAMFTMTGQDLNGINSWLLNLEDKDGNVVKSFSGVGEVTPSQLWNGKDDFGIDAPDGIYTFYLTVQDNAGNRFQTEKKQVRLLREAQMSLLKATPNIFSPNNDEKKDKVEIQIHAADISAVDHWKLNILNVHGKVVKSFEGKDAPPHRIFWDGLEEKKKALPDGTYSMVLSETDNAGNTVSTVPVAVDLDISAPVCRTGVDNKIFSPNADNVADKTNITFNVTDAHLVDWKLQLKSDTGKLIKELKGQSQNPQVAFTWDGIDINNQAVSDGIYTYFLNAVDMADNESSTPLDTIQVDRTPPLIDASVSLTLFSPNRDGILDDTEFMLEIRDASPIKSWELEIKNSAKAVVRTFKGEGEIKKNVLWDGKNNDSTVLPDGTYTWKVYAGDLVGNNSQTEPQSIVIGATKPTVTVKSDLDIFSPNADGFKDSVKFSLSVTAFNKIKSWSLIISDKYKAVRRFTGFGNPPESTLWQGENDDKRPLDDGRYNYVLEVTDEAGNNVVSVPQPIVIDTTKPVLQVNANPDIFSPNADGFKDNTSFSLNYNDESPAELWELWIEDTKGNTQKMFSGNSNPPLTQLWDGKDGKDNILHDGVYNYMFKVRDIVGNQSITPKQTIKIDNTPPVVTLSVNASLFSPNDDGEKDTTTFTLEYKDESDIYDWRLEAAGPNSAMRTFKGDGRPSQNILWDGKNERGTLLQDGLYKCVLIIKDEVGNEGRSVPINVEIDNSKPMVAVLTDEEPMQMLAPTHSFQETKRGIVISLAAELLFDTGEANVKSQAQSMLKKVADLIKRNPDRKIQVEGHTDNVPIHNEEFPDNQILSEKRAQSVVKYFVANEAIAQERFTAKGFGQTKPIAENDTPEGRRKNRRVEVILLK